MTDSKVPKLSLVKVPKAPVIKESKVLSLTSFLKFAEDVSLVEQGIQRSETRKDHVSYLSSLNFPLSNDSILNDLKTSPHAKTSDRS